MKVSFCSEGLRQAALNDEQLSEHGIKEEEGPTKLNWTVRQFVYKVSFSMQM